MELKTKKNVTFFNFMHPTTVWYIHKGLINHFSIYIITTPP